MTGTVVLRALVAKRRELLSALNHHNLGGVRAGHALEHVDATIRLFAGEPGNALVSALWTARKPLSTDDLAARVGMAPKQAGQAMRYLADCGLVRAEKKPGAPVLWVATY
jgi:DNA-binding transcriptional ArsR family regulator